MQLTQEDENKLKNLMLDFIARVFTSDYKSPEEITILPEIIKILFQSSKSDSHKEENYEKNCRWSVTPLISSDGDMSPVAKALIKTILE